MIIEIKPLAEITNEAIKVLCREIGVINTIRFLNQFTTGYGNYTQEREYLFADVTLDGIISEIKRDRV
jgi:hypothetical protein